MENEAVSFGLTPDELNVILSKYLYDGAFPTAESMKALFTEVIEKKQRGCAGGSGADDRAKQLNKAVSSLPDDSRHERAADS
jgi:hypothetical protein